MVIRFQEAAPNSPVAKFSAAMSKSTEEGQKKSKIKDLGAKSCSQKLARSSSRKATYQEPSTNSTDSSNYCASSTSSATSKLSKIGQRLRDSCRNLRAKHASGGSNHSPYDYSSVQAPKDSQRSKHYVPMDFSGREGRIVNYNDLSGNRATKDGYTYFRRKCLPSDVISLLTETQANIHLPQPWFHKGVSRDQSQKILATHAVDGLFLVRDSSVSGGFVISYYFSGKTHHAQVLADIVDGMVTYSLDDGKTRFFDLLQMVEFYQLNKGTLYQRLTHYIINMEAATKLNYEVKSSEDPKAKSSDATGETTSGTKPASPKGDQSKQESTVERPPVVLDEELPKESLEKDKPKPQPEACNAVNNNNQDSFKINGYTNTDCKLKEKNLNQDQDSNGSCRVAIGEYNGKAANGDASANKRDSSSDKEN